MTSTRRWRAGEAAIAIAAVVALSGCDRVKQLVGQRRPPASTGTESEAGTEPLSQSFSAKDGLMTLHYPATFAAQPSDDDVVALSRNLPGGDADVIVFVAVAEPISHELSEFTRVAALSELKRPADWEYRKVSETKATCNKMPGLQIVSTWKPAGVTERSRRVWCAFLRGGHGYVFAYNTPESVAGTHEPLLRFIVEATTFPGP